MARYWHAPSLRPVKEARRAIWREDDDGRRIVSYASNATTARRVIARLVMEDTQRRLPTGRGPTTGAAISAAALEATER